MSALSQVLLRKPKKSKFNLTHDRKTSFKMGKLVPSLNLEVYPGETFEIRPENMFRMAPMVAPVMHDIDIDTHYFFVPNRILWKGWKTWWNDPNSAAVHPYYTLDEAAANNSIAAHLGIPKYSTSAAVPQKLNALPLAAVLMIYDEWFRDNNLGELTFNQGDGLTDGDNSSWIRQWAKRTPLPRSWNRDYFTSGLTGDRLGTDIKIPVFGGQDGVVNLKAADGTFQLVRNANTGATMNGTDIRSGNTSNPSGQGALSTASGATGIPLVQDPNGTLIVPESQAGTIRDLLYAMELYNWNQRQAYGGDRHHESVLAHFGQNTGDARVNRPELIGSLRQKMVISEVLSTAQSADSDIGQMAGHGLSAKGGKKFKYICKEHGWIIGFVSVRPRTAYQQGIHRSMSRMDQFDYMFPNFQHVGEQEVPLKELYVDAVTSDELEETFCYQRRYAELMSHPSTVHGDFRESLAFWHLGRIFTSTPQFNHEFLFSDTASSRIFADTAGEHIWGFIINHVHAIRPLSKYSISQA